jgi:rhodanese-related sulfurtransferase
MDRLADAAQPRAESATLTVAELLEAARSGLPRLFPEEAHDAALAGAVLIDIRSETQRREDGGIATATWIPRNVLEWRLDPASPHRAPELACPDRVVIVLCNEGYQSSLAAATLRRFGLDAADVIGGFQAWRTAGLPVER